jgi:hypothetical protein
MRWSDKENFCMNPTQTKLKHYEERLIVHLKAVKDHGQMIDVGPEPKPEEFDLVFAQDLWAAEQIAKRVKREMARSA